MARIVQETRYELADGELLALDRIRGRELACRSGELWITVDGHAEDIILGPGQRWLAERAPWMAGMAPQDGRASAYVCENFACRAPVNVSACCL